MLGLGLSLSNPSFVGGSSFTGLLDEYSGAAAAYSLRRLSSSYTGPAIQVRNKATQTITDIGFDANGDLDTTALAAAANETGVTKQVAVVTWYDQSGNGNDATQSSGSAQPNIYLGAGPILENGKPAIQFDGSDDVLTTSANDVIHSADWTALITANSYPTDTSIWVTSGFYSTGQSRFLFDLSGVGQITSGYNGFNSGSNLDTYTKGAQQLIEYFATNHTTGQNASVTSYANGLGGSTYNSTSVVTTSSNEVMGIGAQIFTSPYSQHMPMKCQEMVFYNTDQSSNRTGIETNINSYYSIY